MHEERLEEICLEELLLLWHEKHHPDELMHYLFATCIPEEAKDRLHEIGVAEFAARGTMFHAIPAKHEELLKELKHEFGVRIVAISSDELKRAMEEE